MAHGMNRCAGVAGVNVQVWLIDMWRRLASRTDTGGMAPLCQDAA